MGALHATGGLSVAGGADVRAVQRFNFHGSELDVLVDGDDVWISVRRVCEAIGIAHQPQFAKLKAAAWAAVTHRVTTAADGKSYETFVVHLRSLASWLHGIEAWRVKNGAVRAKIELFQKEAADVLASHFLRPKAPGPVAEFLSRPQHELLQLAADLARESHEAAKRATAAEAENARLRPQAAVLAEFAEHEGEFKLRDAAKALGMGPNKFIWRLRKLKVTYGPDSIPYQRHVDAGRFRRVPRTYPHPRTGATMEKMVTLVTTKGFAYLGTLFETLAEARALARKAGPC